MFYHYKLQSVGPDNVIDGDTLRKVVIDLGFDVKITKYVRLARINAPEPGDVKSSYATSRLKDLLSKARNISAEILEKDKYGRALAELYIDGKNVSDILLEEGLVDKY